LTLQRAIGQCVMTASVVVVLLASACAQEFVYDSQGKRNPFIPLVTPDGRFQKLEADERKAAGEELKLEGIMYDKYGISYAVVNGMVVKIGDVIGEFQVLKIEERSAIFMREGQEKTLELKKEEQ
jgi:hypothetical protein